MRLAHVCEKGLHELAKQNLLCGDKIDKFSLCENCIIGKAKTVSFGIVTHYSKNPLAYVHSDI